MAKYHKTKYNNRPTHTNQKTTISRVLVLIQIYLGYANDHESNDKRDGTKKPLPKLSFRNKYMPKLVSTPQTRLYTKSIEGLFKHESIMLTCSTLQKELVRYCCQDWKMSPMMQTPG